MQNLNQNEGQVRLRKTEMAVDKLGSTVGGFLVSKARLRMWQAYSHLKA
jgi:hypothetical protein